MLTDKNDDTPITKDVNVSIYDGNENRVYSEDIPSSEFGIIGGSFTLANEVNSGTYKIVVETNSSSMTKLFRVNPYVAPKYEVTIDFDKENYSVDDTAIIYINAKYFFGEPVVNADLSVYVDDKLHRTTKTDENGDATVYYEIEDEKNHSVRIEATDASNYFVEETADLIVSTDIFKIELLPEYGDLLTGMNNDVYVFTSKPDGSPLKTYVSLSTGEYPKQIATDENGIGKFSLFVNSSSYGELFFIDVTDMDGNSMEKAVFLSASTKSLAISTDKVKYEQGEDIAIDIFSSIDGEKNIYAFKNDKILKMVSTDSSDTVLNLGDEYGLIDLVVTYPNNSSSSYYSYSKSYNTNMSKRTIFIKPNKELNVNISVDKQEYKPGDNITISFGTTDENNANVDSALLVSMLDNSVLNLASNDLSIDNIKLALSGLSFSNELDAATLYSCIVNDASEQTIMALLLRQNTGDINVSETTVKNRTEKQNAMNISIILIIVLVLIIIIFLCIKFKGFRKFIRHLPAAFLYSIAFVCLIVNLIYMLRMYLSGPAFWFILCISLASYIGWASKFIDKTSTASILMIVSCVLFALIAPLIEDDSIFVQILLIGLGILILIFVILSKIKRLRQSRIYKYMKVPMKCWIYYIKFLLAFIISIFIGFIAGRILESLIYRLDDASLAFLITVVSTYLLNYLINERRKGKLSNEENLSIDDTENSLNAKKKSRKEIAIAIFTLFGVLLCLAIVSYVVFLYGRSASVPESTIDSVSSPGRGGYELNGVSPAPIPSLATDSSIDWPDFDWSFGQKNNNSPDIDSSSNQSEDANEIETSVDDNIRKVFLESMCFIPELITTNGSAELDLKLSDNITTWTIQTVGNTKDGKVGYGTLDTVRVFKEFFVDFELPKNLVSTDKVSIPVTVYNYTDSPLNVNLTVKEDSWFALGNNAPISISVAAESTNMVYIPITILESGNHKFRVEATNSSLTDIIEKELSISPNGYKIEKVVSTGILDEDISEDILILDNIIENSASARVKIYPSAASQSIEGIENIFRMPTGCFEQVSSSLYPNILALKYLRDNNIVDEELEKKALRYISSGYQKLLTYEVAGESGGYSLYGRSPAETVLTAYGLMELTDLSEVYTVDEKVLNDMNKFLYNKQSSNGSFKITGYHTGGASSHEELALNAYIIWALSESDPDNEKLSKSIDYLKSKLSDTTDNYTLALIANCLANVEDKEVNSVIDRLINNIVVNDKYAYITSNITDYYGSRRNSQTIQTVALTSMALSKTLTHSNTNNMLINYLISQKDPHGTWYSTQATILSLKALNENNDNTKLDSQTIVIKMNSDSQNVEIQDNPLDYYEVTFDNLNKENKLSIDIENGKAYYEVVEEYYIPYDSINTDDDDLDVSVIIGKSSSATSKSMSSIEWDPLTVNDILNADIWVRNTSMDNIYNGMVTVSIPQGFTVVEESLMALKESGYIEKYETSYTSVNIYLRNFLVSERLSLDVKFRASYPVEITGLAVRAYDYYNPGIEGNSMPIKLTVTE